MHFILGNSNVKCHNMSSFNQTCLLKLHSTTLYIFWWIWLQTFAVFLLVKWPAKKSKQFYQEFSSKRRRQWWWCPRLKNKNANKHFSNVTLETSGRTNEWTRTQSSSTKTTTIQSFGKYFKSWQILTTKENPKRKNATALLVGKWISLECNSILVCWNRQRVCFVVLGDI